MKISDIPIEEKYGYWVFTGEVCAEFEPKREDDEFKCFCFTCEEERKLGVRTADWTDAGYGAFSAGEIIYRRKIPIEAGWELVPLDEKFAHIGSKVMLVDNQVWIKPLSSVPVETPRASITRNDGFDIAIAFIREKMIPPAVQPTSLQNDGWVSVNDGKPPAGKFIGCFLTPNSNGKLATSITTDRNSKSLVYWMPCPPPPKLPVKSPAELAFEKLKDENPYATPSDYFNAGLEFARKEKR